MAITINPEALVLATTAAFIAFLPFAVVRIHRYLSLI